jgi:nondiscriminating glutamyl-tRNA synthetase
MSTRVRFAPSPTGYLHVGGARTLLFNWLFAKQTGGTLVLRVEDTDQARSTKESEARIFEDIRALGLEGDEDPYRGGPYGPYRQSERLPIYEKQLQHLISQRRAYPCFCSEALLEAKRAKALQAGLPPHYDQTCRNIDPKEAEARMKKGEAAGWRFRVEQRDIQFLDLVRGPVHFPAGMVGDFYLTRSSDKEGRNFPVYNFCCAVDDHLMNITTVIRAEEHLSNTLRQILIYQGFGWTLPQFAHISLVLGSDRQKLSKRMGDVSVHDFLAKGYLPEALLNFLLFIGWAPREPLKTASGHPEILRPSERIQSFSFEGLQKAGGIFDLQKLDWMNTFYLHHAPLPEWIKLARTFLLQGGPVAVSMAALSEEALAPRLEWLRSTLHHLLDLPKNADHYFGETFHFEADARTFLPQTPPIAEALKTLLDPMEETLSPSEMDALPKGLQQQTGLKGKELFMPLRVLLTGQTHGPEIRKWLPLLGKARVLKRIDWIPSAKSVSD